MKHSVALIICLSTIQLISTTSLLEDDLLADQNNVSDGFRVRRDVKSPKTRAMLESLRRAPGWKHLNQDICGMSAKSVYSRRKRSVGQDLLKFNVTTRIVGGTEAKHGQFPWMTRIFYRAGPVLQVGCGGTLVSKWHVVTAAHCVAELPKGVIVSSIQLGTDKNAQTLAAEGAFYHSSYDSRVMANDIAIIKTKTPAEFNDYVAPLCLPLGELAEKTFVGQSAIVAGWGKTETAISSSKLLMVNVPVMPNKDCSRKIHAYPIKSSQMCAGGDKGKDSCNGDSGGPLFLMDRQDGPESPLRYTMVGVVSYGPSECGMDGTPGVYSRVSYFLPWILKNMA